MTEQYVLQNNMFDCGIAALKTVFLQFGRRISSEDIICNEKLNQGLTALELINASKRLGVDAKGVKTDLTYLKKKYLPCIAHVIKEKSYFHYLVILKNNFRTKSITIFDPSIGIYDMTYNEFIEISTNIFIVFNNKKLVKVNDKRFLKVLFELLYSNKKTILLCFIISILLIVLSLLFNYYIKYVLQYSTYYIFISLLFIVISLFKNIISFFRDKLIMVINKNIDREINKKFISHIFNLPYNYYLYKKTGELITINNDLSNFKTIVVKIFILCFIDITFIITIIGFMSLYNVIYLGLFILLLLIVLFISLKYQNKFNNKYQLLKNKTISNTTIFLQSLENIFSIKNLSIENKIISKNDCSNKKLNEIEYNYNKTNNNYSFLLNVFEEFFLIITIFISIYLNKSDMYNIILFNNVFILLVGFINNVSENIAMYKLYNNSITKVLDIFDIKEEKISDKKSRINNIEINDVSFSLSDGILLEHINLNINKGDHIFITGPSGIGKSTLAKLILKYYDKYDGKILIDNTNTYFLDSFYIRNNITYVSKEDNLFNDTIYNNLSIINSNEDMINQVLDVCNIHKYLNSKKINSNYVLEENGSNLSSGERMKIIIARALLKNSSVIIFDESFNEISVKEEKEILNKIINNYNNLTIIFISHRKNNIKIFNKKYEINNKKLIEIKEEI